MAEIILLDQNTIDKIAAGEVVERPSSVVKELVENAIDAGATAISVEIKEGGLSLIRVTDNGTGMPKEQVVRAFLRHSTSKIRSSEDLFTVKSLGFRGEALSSIAAVAQVELITKTAEELTGSRYRIEGGQEKGLEAVGAPVGTTFLVRNLFYNTPARRKFLKSAQTEGGYIGDLMEKMALSNPQISFQLLLNGKERLHSSGNGNLKDLIYHIYGREIALNLIEIHREEQGFTIDGFLGKPIVSRGNRSFEQYYINGRYIYSKLLARAIEDGYHSFLMQHRYPFVVLHLGIEGHHLDVNVHPTKMEIRFDNQQELYRLIEETIKQALSGPELIPEVTFEETAGESTIEKKKYAMPQPFESKRLESWKVAEAQTYQRDEEIHERGEAPQGQLELFQEKLLDADSVSRHRIIGQLFKTYWLVEMDEQFYMIDQHAAHEKVLYERFMENLRQKKITSQLLSPPIVLSLSSREEETLKTYWDHFGQLGYEIEHFGGKEYTISAVPNNLYGLVGEALFLEILDGLAEETRKKEDAIILEKLASMSCKAAVKGNQRLSYPEIEALIGDLLKLENPYHCPHGRPTIISMSKTEIEKKFKRIV